MAALPANPIAVSAHDARVVDEDGTLLAPSLHAYENRHRYLDQLSLLIANSISGMSMLATRDAVERALPFPNSIADMLHDWWLALVVAGVGKIARIDEALIDYRQHPGNVIGAKSVERFVPPVLNARRPFLGPKYRTMAREAFASRQRIALELRDRGALAESAAGFFLRRQTSLLIRPWRGSSARHAVRCGIGALLS
jgi:hypothetical protein